MNDPHKLRLMLVILATLLVGSCATSGTGKRLVSVGTGGLTGVYYPAGGAICRLMNRQSQLHGIHCGVESTRGSIYNIRQLQAGNFQFAIAQSDWHFHAYHGMTHFGDIGPFTQMRSLFSLHAEPATLVARDDSGIVEIQDLKGKRVNIGEDGSGIRRFWDQLEKAVGLKRSDLAKAATFPVRSSNKQVCAGELDAHFWVVGHPSSLTIDALNGCDQHLVHVRGAGINRLIAFNPYYRKTVIPAGLYNNQQDIHSFGVGATVVSSTAVPEATVYAMVKSVFDNLAYFRGLHPGFAHLKESEMIKDSLTAPLHAGAVRYYRERGWM